MTIRNKFCCVFGKHEPEIMLSVIHEHGIITRHELVSRYFTRGRVEAWLPFLINSGHVINRGGVLHCRCKACRKPPRTTETTPKERA